MEKLKQSPAELLKIVQIKPIEQECLDRVFAYLIDKDPKKPEEHKKKIGEGDLMKVLTFLGQKPSKSEVKLIIWEVDDDLDGYVSKEEFQTMYKRCISDDTGLEPRKLFNLVQFLMYDKTFKGRVTVEETLQILYVRYGRERLDDEIKAIFGDDEKNGDGSEKEITYGEYVEKINKRALEEQKKIIQARMRGELKKQDNEDQ
ncbi:calmodulin-like protein [Stylonychia lemnae]|uniref:Calmodulin n=1 Tax=Stylonychia lemnae TaxID=5949 RepID=A0A078A7P0_STYLE|nr:calmodulin-like protein [Stylonychia lemnae]|eukprot:CDW78259.1 calmodulin-like protein [Stylonychia lemnae]